MIEFIKIIIQVIFIPIIIFCYKQLTYSKKYNILINKYYQKIIILKHTLNKPEEFKPLIKYNKKLLSKVYNKTLQTELNIFDCIIENMKDYDVSLLGFHYLFYQYLYDKPYWKYYYKILFFNRSGNFFNYITHINTKTVTHPFNVLFYYFCKLFTLSLTNKEQINFISNNKYYSYSYFYEDINYKYYGLKDCIVNRKVKCVLSEKENSFNIINNYNIYKGVVIFIKK